MSENHNNFIYRTYSLATASVDHGNHPFGALLYLDGSIILEAQNTVLTDSDVTKHAEMNLMTLLNRRPEIDVSRAIIYTSTEPCAMCTGAIVWSGIRHIVYGCSSKRLGEISKHPFVTDCRELVKHPELGFLVEGPVLEDIGAALHTQYWNRY